MLAAKRKAPYQLSGAWDFRGAMILGNGLCLLQLDYVFPETFYSLDWEKKLML